jgi:hypothetical protein
MTHAPALPGSPQPPMQFVPLQTQPITHHLLMFLIDQADRGKPDSLLPFLAPEEIDDLRTISVKDLLRLTDQGQPILQVAVDTRQLRLCLSRLHSHDGSEADKLWFVQRGAPHILMVELFGTSEREFRALRRKAGSDARPGRPPAMKAEDELKVLARWRAFNVATPFTQRYRVIGEAFEHLTLAALYNVLDGQTSLSGSTA